MTNQIKLKFPNRINIISFNFKIIADKTIGGGSFDIGKGEIVIGIKHINDDPTYVFNVICHELMEVISELTRTRYDDPSVHGNYKFFWDHKEFELNVKIFAETIRHFIA